MNNPKIKPPEGTEEHKYVNTSEERELRPDGTLDKIYYLTPLSLRYDQSPNSESFLIVKYTNVRTLQSRTLNRQYDPPSSSLLYLSWGPSFGSGDRLSGSTRGSVVGRRCRSVNL